jgi:hypothetical protein
VSGVAINHYISVDLELGAYNQEASGKPHNGPIMLITIDDIYFSGFPGRDFPDLACLTFRGRVDWVEYRFKAFFLETFDRIVALEHETYVWLCVVNLLTSAVDAFAHFEFDDDSGPERFAGFVERYFYPIFTRPMQLSEPTNAHGRPARISAEHFYKYFRSGLAHSFCIEWGGLLHREDGAPEYLFETSQGHNGQRALGIVPRELVRDFRRSGQSDRRRHPEGEAEDLGAATHANSPTTENAPEMSHNPSAAKFLWRTQLRLTA